MSSDAPTSTTMTLATDPSPEDVSTPSVPADSALIPAADVSKQLAKKSKKIRPARPQVDPATIKPGELPPQTGNVFNIWYNKWAGGDREDSYLNKTHAQGRCNVLRDSGYTRADKNTGSYFCLFFARGLCPRGHECEYLHRLPGVHDHFNPNVDCFGRDKFSDYRDDMGGVGSFLRQNRTLYVGRINVTDDIEEFVARQFAEWGDIERIRVLNTRGVAFVTYVNETNAQFAKEAMAHQSLEQSEVLNVRWATNDPNPQAAGREKRKIEEQAAEAIRKALPAEFVAEIEGRDPEAKRRKRIEANFGLDGYEAPDKVWYNKDASGIAQSRAIDSIRQQNGNATAIAPAEDNGIFSSSTLVALKNLSGQSRGRATIAKPAMSARPLVAYGSDDDSS